VIELRNVCKAFKTPRGPNVVLNDVNVTFPALKSVGILGGNGAGKSTLLRILSGAELPDSGEVIRRARLSWPIGFAGGFNGSLSGEENSRFVARIHGEDVDAVVGFTEDFAELGSYFYMPVRTYSSGMRARLAFGLSMAIEFDYYLVDEVTAVGDASFQKKCRKAFATRRERSAVIMVSHNMKTIREYCSTCAILEGGTLRMYESIKEATKHYQV